MRAASRAQGGFTLIEMLVVIVIGAILVSLASLSLTRNPRTELVDEARRLALLFESASDEAQLRSRPVVWQPVPGGYRFMVRDADQWRVIGDDLLRPRTWRGGVAQARIDYAGEHDAKRLVFGTESVGQPAAVTLGSDAGQVVVWTTGNGRYEVRP
ncbi:GspH/FimT family pseudopilin [Chitinasiproducens palmae]|uniref:Type II secretion system protein H n=1 Tax=Chitinasiproducens palmae TaxID=1770053 RepID=A0A1H2PP59_9BURK|nr:GspH/FimT family pseudopilin [Chitinasiproducens palmae]SDV48487.1 type II secretion system protein H (GspH) [Chitinasiproducens palmae]